VNKIVSILFDGFVMGVNDNYRGWFKG